MGKFIDQVGLEIFDELFLEFVDLQEDLPEGYVVKRVADSLEEFEFDEILAENDMGHQEALEILFELGYVGLPDAIEYTDTDTDVGNDSEEVQDNET